MAPATSAILHLEGDGTRETSVVEPAPPFLTWAWAEAVAESRPGPQARLSYLYSERVLRYRDQHNGIHHFQEDAAWSERRREGRSAEAPRCRWCDEPCQVFYFERLETAADFESRACARCYAERLLSP